MKKINNHIFLLLLAVSLNSKATKPKIITSDNSEKNKAFNVSILKEKSPIDSRKTSKNTRKKMLELFKRNKRLTSLEEILNIDNNIYSLNKKQQETFELWKQSSEILTKISDKVNNCNKKLKKELSIQLSSQLFMLNNILNNLKNTSSIKSEEQVNYLNKALKKVNNLLENILNKCMDAIDADEPFDVLEKMSIDDNIIDLMKKLNINK